MLYLLLLCLGAVDLGKAFSSDRWLNFFEKNIFPLFAVCFSITFVLAQLFMFPGSFRTYIVTNA